MSKKFTLSALFGNKKFVLFFSFFIAVITWFIVSVQVSPITSRSISDVSIDFQLDSITTTTALKAYTGSDTKVKVTVSGKRYIVDSLSADSVMVTANLDNVTGSGNYILSLVGKKSDMNADFSIVSIEPSTVAVELDSEATKNLDLNLNVIGATVGSANTEGESLVLENELVNSEHSTITVTGPSNEIEKIASAEAYTEVNRLLTESQQLTARVRLYDADGNIIFDPQNAETSLIKNTQFSVTSTAVMANVYLQKTVPLTISTKNMPSMLPDIKIYEVIPESEQEKEEVTEIRIRGPQEKIKNITSIMLDGVVDFSIITPNTPSSFTINMSLPSYSDVIFADYKNHADVSFDVSIANDDLATKVFNVPDENINIVVPQDGGTAKSQSTLKGITVVGPKDDINRLKASDIFATVVLSEKTAGAYVKNVEFNIENVTTCWVYGKYELTLEISL